MELSIIKKSGFALIEVVLAIAIFSMFSVGITYLSLDILQADEKVEEGNFALLYTQEGLEAARQMRDRNFLLLEDGDHGLDLSDDEWTFIPAPEDIDGYYDRTVSVEDVYRDVDGDIAETGTLDPDTKKVTSTVEWNHRGLFPKSIELSTYLSNWSGDDWIQTDCDEFNAGVFEDTEVEFTDSPPEDNCALKLALEEVESEFYASADVGSHGNDVWVEGNYAYVAVNKSNQGLAVVDITDRENPFVVKQVDVGGKAYSVVKHGNYVYVGVRNYFKGLAVVDASTPANASLVDRTYVLGEGLTIEPNGDYLYMGVKNYLSFIGFSVIDISDPDDPYLYRFQPTFGRVYDIEIVGDYAYCGIDFDWWGFQILDISDPSDIDTLSFLSVGEEVNAVEIQGPYAYLGTEDDDDSFYVVNISDPDDPHIEDHIDVGDEIEDISLRGDYAYLAFNNQNSGLAAVNVATPTSPYFVYARDVLGKGTGIKTDENYIYETLNTNNRGLVIIGTTVTEVIEDGTYVSVPYDTNSSDTRYNFIEWEGQDVPGGEIRLQLKTASSEAGLASATWIGDDGTEATYYEGSRTPIVVDPAASGTRYVQFKVYIDSDGANTPLIESVRINYTP